LAARRGAVIWLSESPGAVWFRSGTFHPANSDPVSGLLSLRSRSKRPVPDGDEDNSVHKNAEAETKRRRIHLSAALYSYYSTLDYEGDEIDWNQLSGEEFESKIEKMKVKDRERIAHRDIVVTRTWHFARVTSQRFTVDR
jgi:hypothetical protein